MSAHTPKPWANAYVDGETAVVEALSPDGKLVVREICHVLDPDDFATPEEAAKGETMANLNLIAAAPDMLEELRAVAELLDRCACAKMEWADAPAKRVHALIARAEGR